MQRCRRRVGDRSPLAGRIVPWLSLALQVGFAVRSWAGYRRWPALPDGPTQIPLPSVSIIVPARDESDNLLRLLPSLLCLEPAWGASESQGTMRLARGER